MRDDEYNLFESVIHITEGRDKRSLEKSLVKTLSDFIDFDALILLRLPRNEEDDYLETAVSQPSSAFKEKLELIPYLYGDERVRRDSGIQSCIENHEMISEESNGERRTLIPITVNNVVVGILDVYGHQHTAETDRLILGLIRIYSNFLAIIDDNERDTLTGLLNRKTFDAQLSELLSSNSITTDATFANENRRMEKTDTYHWVVILDVDLFKKVNDSFGHVYGDEVLLLFANLMEETFRSGDLLFRYGGEEFVVVLAPATEQDAFLAIERFRKKLELYDFPQVGKVTVSAGMVRVDAREQPSTVLEHADQALYYAKEHGRNQVCDYHTLVKSGAMKTRYSDTDIELF